MKTLIASVLFLSGFQAQAVQVSDCPQSLQWQVEQFSFDPMLNPSRVPGLRGDCLFDCDNDEGIVNLQHTLNAAARLSAQLSLVSASHAICRYEGRSSTNEEVQAEIRGTFAHGSKNPAYIVVEVGGGAFYSGLKTMSPTQVEIQNRDTKVYYRGEYCSHGDCISDHIKVGIAEKTNLIVTP